ncbi:MAG: hypothetical protein JWQ09_1940 [Segetibacter sp.]|nr:hypothetical protein [Segetibacter sp.]
MCATSIDGLSKKCSCKFAHLCKRHGIIETLQEKPETDLNEQATFNKAISALAFNYAEVNKHIHVQKGNHI